MAVGCACKKFTSYLSFRHPIGYAMGNGYPITGTGYTPKLYFLRHRHVHTGIYDYFLDRYQPDEDWTITWSTETRNYGSSNLVGSRTLGEIGGNLDQLIPQKITAPGRYIFTGNFTTYVEGGPFGTTDYLLTSFVPSIITTIEVREVVAAYGLFQPPIYGNLTRYFDMQLDDAFMRAILLRDLAFPETCPYSSTPTPYDVGNFGDYNTSSGATVPVGGVQTYTSEELYAALPPPQGWPVNDWPADGTYRFDQAYHESNLGISTVGSYPLDIATGLAGLVQPAPSRMMQSVLVWPGHHSLQTRSTAEDNTGTVLECDNVDVECPVGAGTVIEPPEENHRRIVWIENQVCPL